MTEPTSSVSQVPPSRFLRASKFCAWTLWLWTPLVFAISGMTLEQHVHKMSPLAVAATILSGLVLVAGFVAGIFALLGIRQPGKFEILWRVVPPMLAWFSFMSLIVAVGVLTDRERARNPQRQTQHRAHQ